MSTEYRYAPFEFREGGEGGSPGTLAGVAMRYGDVADIGPFHERFEPGAFGDVAARDVLANWQHSRSSPLARTGGGGLTLSDSPEALRAEVVLPATSQGRDVAELSRRRVLRGFSVEFRNAVDRIEGGVRVISKADLVGIGIVDVAAYSDSVISYMRSRIEAAAAPRRRRVWL